MDRQGLNPWRSAVHNASGNTMSLVLAAIAGATCLGLAIIRPDSQQVNWIDVAVVVLLGGALGQALFAAVWAAIGPGAYAWRTPASLVWIGCLFLALYLNPGFAWPRNILPLLALRAFAYWIAIHILALILVRVTRLKINRENSYSDPSLAPRQFTNQQMLLLMTSVCLFLGAVRFCLLAASHYLFGYFRRDDQGIIIWMFVAAIFLFPALYLSSLARRWPVWLIVGSLAALLLEGLFELYLAANVTYSTELHEMLDLFLNLFCLSVVSTAWFLTLCLSLRTAGYRVQRGAVN
jgi:hypothetical protein